MLMMMMKQEQGIAPRESLNDGKEVVRLKKQKNHK